MEEKPLHISLDTVLTGQQLHSIMINNGYTIKELQEMLDLKYPQSIYRWIHGITLPSVDNLYRMSKLFHVHMEDMLVETQK